MGEFRRPAGRYTPNGLVIFFEPLPSSTLMLYDVYVPTEQLGEQTVWLGPTVPGGFPVVWP